MSNTTGDLISRSALIAELSKCIIIPDDYYTTGIMAGVSEAMRKVKAAPAVEAVEVVRCKDCVHKTVTSDGMVCKHALPTKRLMDYFIHGSVILAKVGADDFCSYGERRADDERQRKTD